MHAERRKRVHARVREVKGWPVWGLPRWLIAFVVVVTLADVAVAAVVAGLVPVSLRDLGLAGALLLCMVATVELTKRGGESTGLTKDVYAVWELPLAILLPPVFAIGMPAIRFALTQWRIRRIALHRRVFSAAVVGLSYVSASLVFHVVTRSDFGTVTAPHVAMVAWLLAVALAAVAQWVVNTTLLFPAVHGADPTIRMRDLYLGWERVNNDVAELCVAVLVTLGIAVTPLTIVFAFPFVTLLQRSFRHSQLVNASRVDSKTGLLNAGTWEREAASEVTRALRTRTPLALALVDVDHFKAVNDVHGHLAGDQALKTISRTLAVALRDYDIIGRFGGEEFAVLLPHTGVSDAQRIAERMRALVGTMPVESLDGTGPGPIRVTVSVGVAALGSHEDSSASGQLTNLIAAADRALYRAKQAGRDQVWVVTDTELISSPPEPPAPSAPPVTPAPVTPVGSA